MLIVYEGYEEPPKEVDESLNKLKGSEYDSLSGGNCSYDADASNDSMEMNSTQHEEHEIAQNNNCTKDGRQPAQLPVQHPLNAKHTHPRFAAASASVAALPTEADKRSLDELAVRDGATAQPFVPISEDTVFLDTDPVVSDPVTSSGISTMSSPMSCDSWMNYSSNSSDDLSAISDRIHTHQPDSSEESSLEYDSTESSAQSTQKIKRNFNNLLLSNGPEYVTVATNSRHPSQSEEVPASIGQIKRLRGKLSGAASSSAGPPKRKASLHRNSSLTGTVCDIRMIDFAHTTFLRKNIDSPSLTETASGAVQHQGPDNGFLRGIESLKRLFSEILSDEQESQ